jgi:hypothetical protein
MRGEERVWRQCALCMEMEIGIAPDARQRGIERVK